MKKLSPLQVSQKLSQASGDKASLRWAKGQEARKAAQPKKPKVWNVTPFSKSGASMSVSAFGVEHGGEIAKANYEPPNQERGYRGGIGSGLNPRSKTYVKRGTAGARASRAIGNEVVGGVKGGVAGAVGGAALGALTRKPGAIKVGAAIGGNAGVGIGSVHGAQVGREKNIKSGDTMAFHRRTGAKAVGQHKLGPMSGMRRYGSTPLNNTL